MLSTFSEIQSSRHYLIGNVPEEQLSPLLHAAREGHLSKLEPALNQVGASHPTAEEALCVAAMNGYADVVGHILKIGVRHNPPLTQADRKLAWHYSLTAMGQAILHRQRAVIEVLLQHKISIEEISRDTHSFIFHSALDLFFWYHAKRGADPQTLEMILNQNPCMHSLKQETVFRIGVYASCSELELLFQMGFDPKSIFREERKPHKKGKDSISYSREVTLLDLCIMQAERAPFLPENPDSIAKVRLLIERETNVFSRNNFCEHNYLHQVSLPSLIEALTKAGVKVKEPALLHTHAYTKFYPIEAAYTEQTVALLCAAGENLNNAPFTKGTKAYQEALARVGYNPSQESHLDANGELFYIKAYIQSDIAAFVALLGAGVNVNQQKQTESQWTSLHTLFSKINSGSVSEEYDYVCISTDFTIRLINMLIRSGAKPLRDKLGRTPLMCLTHNSFNTVYNNQIINMYIHYEAAHYGIDPYTYKTAFQRLRQGGFRSQATLGPILSVPIQSAFDAFWASFESGAEFNPPQSHNPTASWNALRTLWG